MPLIRSKVNPGCCSSAYKTTQSHPVMKYETLSKKVDCTAQCDMDGPPAHTTASWEVTDFKRGPDQPRASWRGADNKYL